jgi:hypothetical protein
VKPEVKHRTILFVAGFSLSAILVLLVFWASSSRHTPLQYLVAGTLATSILLAAAFVQVVRRGYLGRPRSEQTSPGKSRTSIG